jgi:hypothetical protein
MPLLPVAGGQQNVLFSCNGGVPVGLSPARVMPAFTLPIFPVDITLHAVVIRQFLILTF